MRGRQFRRPRRLTGLFSMLIGRSTTVRVVDRPISVLAEKELIRGQRLLMRMGPTVGLLFAIGAIGAIGRR